MIKTLPRLRSIDAFRAVTMWLMVFVNDIEDIPNTPQWIHHVADDVDGMGLADAIFPAFLFIAAVALLTERWWLYGLFSIGYFLNNEVCLKSFKEYNYDSFVFNLKFPSALFMLTILILLFYLYEATIKKMIFKKRILKT